MLYGAFLEIGRAELEMGLFIETIYFSKSRNVKIQIMYKYYHTRTQKPLFET